MHKRVAGADAGLCPTETADATEQSEHVFRRLKEETLVVHVKDRFKICVFVSYSHCQFIQINAQNEKEKWQIRDYLVA